MLSFQFDLLSISAFCIFKLYDLLVVLRQSF